MIRKVSRKQDVFFSAFDELMGLTVLALGGLRRLATVEPFLQAESVAIVQLQERGDLLLIDLNLDLAKAFITPLDREDIYCLANGLNGLLGAICDLAHRLVDFRVEAVPKDALAMIDSVDASITTISEALRCLQSGKGMTPLRQVITGCGRRGDEISRRAIGQMFEERGDIYELLKWKTLYEHLESLLERCEESFLIVEELG